MTRFNVFCTDNYFNADRFLHLIIFDSKEKTIYQLKAGNRQDMTSQCKKMYDANNRKNDWYNSKQGATYYRALVENEIEELERKTFKNILATDNKNVVDEFVLNAQIKQLQENLRLNIGYTYI